jgi:pimeloyl-ACP methyl ester carboxylesterase
MTIKISRHFVTVGQRRVHYARAGEGPVVVLLHASPVSFKATETIQRVYAEHFTVLAFDTPGFGLSDPLPVSQPEIESFADALAETLTELGIDRVAVHGRHTGAQIAVEFAARYPARCSMAITDGFPIFPEEVRRHRPDAYLLPIIPSWEGSHLLWLWYRYREQYVFWPWNLHDAAHRADSEVPDPAFIHRGVVEFLEAGDGYRIGYASAYRHRGLAALEDLKVPVCFGWRPGDSLFDHRSRLPQDCWSEVFPREAEAAARAEVACLLKHPAQRGAPSAPKCASLPNRSTTDYVDVGEHRVLMRRFDRSIGSSTERPIVCLHPIPGSSALLDPLMQALAAQTGREIIAFDLPGHGETVAAGGAADSIAQMAGASLRVIETLLKGPVDLVGVQGGAAVAVELMRLAPNRIRHTIVVSPVCLTPQERDATAGAWLDALGETRPDSDGFHLLRLWHMRRDMALWWPWHDRRRESIRPGALAIAPEQLTIEVREMIKQPEHLGAALEAVLRYPMAEHLSGLPRKPGLVGRADDPWAPCLAEAAQALGLTQAETVRDDDELVQTIVRALGN